MRIGSVRRGTALLVGGVLVVGLTLAGCAKESETLVQDSETAAEAPTAPTDPTPLPTLTDNIVAAQLSGPSGVAGEVAFTPSEGGGVRVVATVRNAPPGNHGFHLHAVGSCDGDFTSAGGHFDPADTKTHGRPDATPRHGGDFGNIVVEANGTGNLDVTTDLLSIGTGAGNDVIGKAVILHEKEDDFGQPTGNAGARIACGVVLQVLGQVVTEATPAPAGTPVM